ncbi:hypothetical protein Tco_0357396 [Tanacetum coccineum]
MAWRCLSVPVGGRSGASAMRVPPRIPDTPIHRPKSLSVGAKRCSSSVIIPTELVIIQCEIDRASGGKLHDKNTDESWEIIENLTLYDHEG